MSEEPQNVEPVYRYIILVDGDAYSKAIDMEGVVSSVRDIQGTTNDEVEVFSIH